MKYMLNVKKFALERKMIKGFFLSRIVTDYPLAMSIEVTNKCNLHCSFCPRDKLTKNRGFMGEKLFKSIIDNIYDDNRKIHLLLNNFGEPLMHDNLCDFIKYAKKKGVAKSVKFATNGSLLTEKIFLNLADSGLDELKISIDAENKDDYFNIKKYDLCKIENILYEIKNIKLRLGLKKPRVVAKIMVRQNEKSKIKSFSEKWRRSTDEIMIDWYSNFGGILEADVDASVWRNRYACSYLWYRMVVGWDGVVVPCCNDINDVYPLGTLMESTVAEIWRGEMMNKLRRAHREGRYKEFPLCRNCSDWLHQPNISKRLR